MDRNQYFGTDKIWRGYTSANALGRIVATHKLQSHLPGSQQSIKEIGVANTAIYFHDGRALATCKSGLPMRILLPELATAV
ncbi:MAG: hypothetical protein LQ339_007599 [Xanthoria mediterranea]|nr:MAG: hypothetical protein LQ339_007599 [Xanthoria mediterranea]